MDFNLTKKLSYLIDFILSSKDKDPTAKYGVTRQDTIADPSYYGFITEAGSWYIMKEAIAAGTFTYINGKDDFTAKWGSRAGLSYKEFDELNW